MDDAEATFPREELLRILLAVRAVARASGPLDFRRILSAVLEQIRTALKADTAGIYMLDAARATLVWADSLPPPPAALLDRFRELPLVGTLSGRVVASRRPISIPVADLGPLVPALESIGLAFIGITPLFVQDRPCGVLHLGRSTSTFDDHELRLAETLGELLVVYLENAKLYADAQARLEETAMLLDVARSVTASLDLKQRLIASADGLARLVDASNAFILLADETGELVISESDSHWSGETRGFRIPRTSAAAAAVRARHVVIVEDATTSDVVFRTLVERFDVKSLIAIPLFISEQLIGCVVAIETRQRRAWTDAQVQRAEVIAHQIAIAVAHARLYDEVKRSYDELARTQQELVKRERLAALGQLAATLAHEVRNPLGVLFNSISTLGKTTPLADDARTLLAIMDEEARRLERLVRELLEFVRPVMPALSSESLHDVVEEAIEAAARELGPNAARLANEVSPSLPLVPVDSAMLRRALLNLIVNGGQAAGSSGKVAVRASVAGAAGVRIEIVDDGPGIRPDAAPRVFEPFFTTKATGTGLGLAIVKEIVDAHQGAIEVHSEEGRGTTIAIELPLLTGP